MGYAYANLSTEAKGVLQEIARMAYGIGSGDGRNGGAGRMGLLNGTTQGTFRVVKFNTHLGERWTGPSADADMWASSNKLRGLLLKLGESAGLEQQDMNRIRAQLKLPLNQDTVNKLLDRRNVAKVVSIIGGNEVWDDALAGKNMADYQSAEHTRFADLTNQDYAQTTGVKNVKTIDETKDIKGVYGQLVTAAQSKLLPKSVINAVKFRLVNNLDRDLKAEGYLSSLKQQTVENAVKRLVEDLQLFSPENVYAELSIPERDELVAFASARIRMLLKADKYVLATYGKDAYQDVRVMEKFGVSPEALDLQVTQMARKYGFSENERKTIFQIAARQMAQQLRAQGPADVPQTAAEMNEGLKDGVSIAVFTGMAACREGNERRRNEIIEKVGWLENTQVKRLLEYFDNLSGVGGFDGKDHWNAFGTYLWSIDRDDFFSTFNYDGFFERRTKEVESYRADVVAVEKLNAEIDAFCKEHGEEYRALLKVPSRSFEACVGSAKPSSYCEPYARYRFELVKRIVGADLYVRYGDELVPWEVKPDDVAKMLDGKFDEVSEVDGESVKELMCKAGLDALKNMSFQEKGLNGKAGANFAEALDKLVSQYPQDKRDAVREILLNTLERKLLANGPILGPDGLQTAVSTLFKSNRGNGADDTDAGKLAPILSSVPADDLVAIRDSGIDLLEIVRDLPDTGTLAADGHLLALLVRSQQGGQASFAGRENELVQKIAAFEQFIRSDAMPPALRFSDEDQTQHLLAIVASSYPGLVDFVNAVSAGVVPDVDKANFLAFVQPKMAKLQDVLSQLARYMVGHEASQEVFEGQLSSLMTNVYFLENGMNLLKVIGDDERMNGLLDELKENYDYFGSVRKDGEKLLGEMRKLGVLEISDIVDLLGDEPMSRFVQNGIMQPLPADHSLPTGYSAKMTKRISDRRAALEKYEDIRSEDYDGTRETKIRTTAAEIVMRLLSCVNVKYFANEDKLNDFFELLCTALREEGGVFDQIDACLRNMGTAAKDKAKAEVFVSFYKEMGRCAVKIAGSDELLSNCPYLPEGFYNLESDAARTFLNVILDSFMTADSRVSCAFDDLMRTNIGLLTETRVCEDYHIYKERKFQAWEDNGLAPGGGILDADDVTRLTRYGLTPSVIKIQIAPTVTRLGLTKDEQRSVVQALSAILASRLRQWGDKVDVRQVLAGLADGTNGSLVAALLLCKGGDAADPTKWKTRLRAICNWSEASRDLISKEARLVMLSDEQGAKLKTYFDLAVAKLGQLAKQNGWPVEDNRWGQWGKFARFILKGELGISKNENYLEERKTDFALLEADVNAVEALNKQINATLKGKFNEDDLRYFESHQLTISSPLSLTDLLSGPREKTIRAPQAKLRLALIQAIPAKLTYASDPNSHAVQTVSLTAAEFYAVLNGEFDTLTRLPPVAVDLLRTLVAKTAFEVIMSLEYKRDDVEVPESVKTVSDYVDHAISFLPDEKKVDCRDLLSRSFENWLRANPLTLDDTMLSDVVENLSTFRSSTQVTLVGNVSLHAQAMSINDLSIIEKSNLDVVEFYNKVKALCRQTQSNVNETACWHVLSVLLEKTTERNPEKLAVLIARFFSVLSSWRQSAGNDSVPDYALGAFAITSSQYMDLGKLQSNDPKDWPSCVDFRQVTGRLWNVTGDMYEIAGKIVGENPRKDDLDEVVRKLFKKLSLPKNLEVILTACRDDKGRLDLRRDLLAELNTNRSAQTEAQALQDVIRGADILRPGEIPNMKYLLGVDLADNFYNSVIVSHLQVDPQVDPFSNLKSRIQFRKDAISNYRNLLPTLEGHDLQAAKAMLHILGRLPVKLLDDQKALDALYARLKQDLPNILAEAQPHLAVLNAQASSDNDKMQAVVALVQQVALYANRYGFPTDALAQVMFPPGRRGSDEVGAGVSEITNALAQVVFGGNESVTAAFTRLKSSVDGGAKLDNLISPFYREPQGLHQSVASELLSSVVGFFDRSIKS